MPAPIRRRRGPPTTPCSKSPGPLIPVVILVVDRDPVVQAAVLPAQHPGAPRQRPHHQGDRQAVVLDLQLSGQRQVRVRLADGPRRRAQLEGQPRLLAVDNEMVVPVNKIVRVQTTGADVIHAFAVPSFGIKIDCDPGPPQRDLVQGDARGRLLRPVLGAVRQGPRLHADRGPRGERAGIHDLGRGGARRNSRART